MEGPDSFVLTGRKDAQNWLALLPAAMLHVVRSRRTELQEPVNLRQEESSCRSLGAESTEVRA